MWSRNATTTTHGYRGFSRQCVCTQKYVNFLPRFGLHELPELRFGGETALSRPKTGIYL